MKCLPGGRYLVVHLVDGAVAAGACAAQVRGRVDGQDQLILVQVVPTILVT